MADRLLVTIVIAVIDIQQNTSTVLHKLSVSAVQLRSAVHRHTVCIHYVYSNLQLLY